MISCKVTAEQRLFLYVVAYALSFGSAVVFSIIQSVVLSKDADSTLASYATIRSMLNITSAILTRAITTSTRTLVGRAHSSGAFYKIKYFIQWSAIVSIMAGFLSLIILFVFRVDLVNFYDTKGQLNVETKDAIIFFAIGVVPGALGLALNAVLVGFLDMWTLLTITIVIRLTFALISLVLFIYFNLGLFAFGWAYLISNIVELTSCLIGIFGPRSNRQRYDIELRPFCPKQKSDAIEVETNISNRESDYGSLSSEIRLAYLKAVRGVSGQTITGEVRSFLSILFVVRSGVTQASVFVLLLRLSDVTTIASDGIGFAATVLGPRLLGAGEASEGNAIQAPNYKGFFAFTKFAYRFVILWAIMVILVYSLIGKNVILFAAPGNATESITNNPYEPFVTDSVFAMFLMYQISVASAVIFESILLGSHDFQYLGAQSLVAFFLRIFANMSLWCIG